MTATTFTNETEAARRTLFSGVRIGNLGPEDRYLSFSGILPAFLPDGIRMLLLPDVHAPAHHKQIFRSIFQFQKWYRPHIVLFIGDLNDLLALSRWPKLPRVVVNAQHEIDETRSLIYKVVKMGALWVIVIDGNHEDRLIRWLASVTPVLAHYVNPTTRQPICSLPDLMGFTRQDPVTFITGRDERGGFEGGLWVNEEYKLEHGTVVKPTPGDSVRAHCEKYMRNSGTGHTHRMGNFARKLHDSRVLRGNELGCLVDWDTPNFGYAPGHDWHHGFGVGTVFGGKLHVQSVPIIQSADERGDLRYFFTFGGQVFSSSDR